jgi:peptidyl-Asp metalloendopeptidase
MNDKFFKPSLMLAALLSASGAVSAATESNLDFWLWLSGLPNWLLAALVAIPFVVLASLGLSLYHRTTGQARGLVDYATLSGALIAGLLVALLAADPWNAYLSDKLTALPPTAAVPDHARGRRALDLLDEPDIGDVQGPPQKPAKVRNDRARHAKVNVSAIESDTLNLNLFDDIDLVAVRDSVVEDGRGGLVWLGHIEGYEEDSHVTLAAKGRVLMGTVSVDGRFFEIVYVGGNTHAVRELDPNRIPAQFEPEQLPTPDDLGGGDLTTETSTPTGGDTLSATGEVIDVMVVYTPKARLNAGGPAGIETKIMNAVARANQAYQNSQIDMYLNLVHMQEIAYTETGDMVTSWSRVMGTSDGYMDDVHALRNSHGADQVVLITADSNYCGYATIMSSTWRSTAFAPWAFSVLHDDSVYNCLGSNDSFAHELGHNQGNVHDPDNSSSAGAYPDSYGYRECGRFRDIMSYSCSGEPRIPYFSNPNLTYNGYAIGIEGYNDTARSMNSTAPIVASFRASVTSPPTAPGSLNATNVSTTDSTALALRWSDNAGNEAGYKVQGSVDGSNWAEIASLPENATSFNDTGLISGQTYYYRVYAYNSFGNSTYSNTASATPTAPQLDTTAPTVRINSPADGAQISGVVSISAGATDDVGVTGLKLYRDGELIGVSSTGSVSTNWNTRKAANGLYTIRAEATDAQGNLGTASIQVRIGTASEPAPTDPTEPATPTDPGAQDTIAPVVNIANPQDGDLVSGVVSIRANATDNVGVTAMQLLIDGNQVATSSSGSLSSSWNTRKATRGTHVISIKATDAAGNAATASVTVTVN